MFWNIFITVANSSALGLLNISSLVVRYSNKKTTTKKSKPFRQTAPFNGLAYQLLLNPALLDFASCGPFCSCNGQSGLEELLLFSWIPFLGYYCIGPFRFLYLVFLRTKWGVNWPYFLPLLLRLFLVVVVVVVEEEWKSLVCLFLEWKYPLLFSSLLTVLFKHSKILWIVPCSPYPTPTPPLHSPLPDTPCERPLCKISISFR